MAIQDHYKIVSHVIRIASLTDQSHQERLKSIAHVIVEAFDCAAVTFFLADSERLSLNQKISTASPEALLPCQIPFGKGVAGKCAANQQILYRSRTVLHPDEPLPGSEQHLVAVPIFDHEQLVGVVSLGLLRKSPLTESEYDLLQVILVEAAGIIRCKSQLEGVSKRLRELSFLQQISNFMLSTIKLDRLANLILTSLTAGSAPLFDRAMLFLVNERAQVIQGMMGATRPHASTGLPPAKRTPARQDADFDQLVRATRLPLDRGRNLISVAVLDKQLVHGNKSCDRRLDRDYTGRFGSPPYAIAPLIAQERVVGVLIVDNNLTLRPLADDDLRLVQLFANQAGMAIENSILYNRLEDSNRSLHETQEQLLQGEKLAAIGKMAAGIAHEIKNPLVSVGGFAERLKRKLPENSEEWHNAALIIREVQHLEELLTDILFFAKKNTICYNRCGINQIIDDALAVSAINLENKGIIVVREFAPRLPSLLGDCQQLRHVFMNLINNACEVMEPGGTLHIETAVAHIDRKRAVSVKVIDTGSGIPLELLHTIFNPFVTTKEMGTGLGLSIVDKIVASHCGKIEASNRPEGGAEFTVTLPTSP